MNYIELIFLFGLIFLSNLLINSIFGEIFDKLTKYSRDIFCHRKVFFVYIFFGIFLFPFYRLVKR